MLIRPSADASDSVAVLNSYLPASSVAPVANPVRLSDDAMPNLSAYQSFEDVVSLYMTMFQ